MGRAGTGKGIVKNAHKWAMFIVLFHKSNLLSKYPLWKSNGDLCKICNVLAYFCNVISVHILLK